MQASGAGRSMLRALAAAMTLTSSLGVAPTSSPAQLSASDVLARITASDARVASYAVPVHIAVRVKKLFTFRFRLDGTQYFKRPAQLTLDVPRIPAQGRRLFAELGTPLTWAQQYDLHLAAMNGERGAYRLEGVPKHASEIARMVVDVDPEAGAPLHARWWTTDGSTIEMRITERDAGGYELPNHAEADLDISGTKIHASIEYGAYDVQRTADGTTIGSSETTRLRPIVFAM